MRSSLPVITRLATVVATLLLPCHLEAGSAPVPQGVVVESVFPGTGAERSGILPGDVLLSWTRAAVPALHLEAASGPFNSPFDLREVETEQVARGPVRLAGLRDGVPFEADVAGAPPFFRVRPVLGADDLAEYEAGRALASQGRAEEALEHWRRTLAAPERAPDPVWAAALYFTAAEERVRADDELGGRALYHAAIGEVRKAERRDGLAMLLEHVAPFEESVQQVVADVREAVAIRRSMARESVATAQALGQLAGFLLLIDETTACRQALQEARDLLERLAPESAVCLRVLQKDANLHLLDGDLEGAEQLQRRVVERVERLLPESELHANALFGLGGILNREGRAEAEDAYVKALELRQRPGRSLGDSLPTLITFGEFRTRRGDLNGAETLLRRGLEIAERVAPGTATHAFALNNMGDLAAARGNSEEAAGLYRRTLGIFEAGGRENVETAIVLESLARAELALGRPQAAAAPLERAVALHEKLFPGGLYLAQALEARGELREQQGRLGEAQADHGRALELLGRSGMRGWTRARSSYHLALIARRLGDAERAQEHFQKAIAAVEEDAERASASEMGRATSLALHGDLYREAADLLAERGRPAEAFAHLERWRARSLLQLMAERDLSFSGDLPPELDAERRTLDVRYVQARERLLRASSSADAAAAEKARFELRTAGERLQAMAERLRRSAPRFAAARYPQPLDLGGVRTALEPGTLLLSYAVGPQRTLLFAVAGPEAPGGTAAFELFVVPESAARLRERVAEFRKLLRQRPPAGARELAAASGELYRLLVEPAQRLVDDSRRLLIAADGPLHQLPFAALERDGRYLAEIKPLSSAASVTLLQQLQAPPASPASGATLAMAAFGDPALARRGSAEAGPLRERAASLRFALDPLPAARQEALSVSSRFGKRGLAYVGAEASEANARSAAARAERLHFATHALLDERAPLHSALVLATPAAASSSVEDGLLEAWEVLNQVRLQADLVTLSACDTGLGPDLGGEGLASLARVFQYAGARSVLASLWRVPDDSTSALMDRFYRELSAGVPKDEALQRAQLALLRSRHKHPYYWAGFQLHGRRR